MNRRRRAPNWNMDKGTFGKHKPLPNKYYNTRLALKCHFTLEITLKIYLKTLKRI